MPEFTEALLKEKIKEEPIGAYLLYGEEGYLVKVYTDKLIEKSVDESFRDFNLRVYNGDDASLEDIYDSVAAVPMMAESKCVVVKDYPIESATDTDLETLAMIVKENPVDNCLVFSYSSGTPKKNFKDLEKLFKENGVTVNFSAKDKNDLVRILESGAKKRNKLFDRGVADYLAVCVGADLNLLINELEKVCAYSQGETITRADVDAVCIKSLETRVFDMITDLTGGHFDAAFRKLTMLFEQREDEYMILGALISQYVDMYRAKAVRASGVGFDQMGLYYQAYKGKTFKLDKAARAAASLSDTQLKECLSILARSDTVLKSTSADKKQVLEQTIVNLARAGR